MDKKQLSEIDICEKFISPAIARAGWNIHDQIFREYPLRVGQTLKLLSLGDRVWVKIPQTGFVGVGEVTESVQSAKDFTVATPEGDRSALNVLQHGPLYRATADDPEQAEYFCA